MPVARQDAFEAPPRYDHFGPYPHIYGRQGHYDDPQIVRVPSSPLDL